MARKPLEELTEDEDSETFDLEVGSTKVKAIKEKNKFCFQLMNGKRSRIRSLAKNTTQCSATTCTSSHSSNFHKALTTDDATPQSKAFFLKVSQWSLSANVLKHRTWTPATLAWSLMILAISAIGAVSTLSVASTTDRCNRLKALTGRCSKSDRWMRHGVELQRWAQTSRFFVTLSLSCLQAGLAAARCLALGSK